MKLKKTCLTNKWRLNQSDPKDHTQSKSDCAIKYLQASCNEDVSEIVEQVA